MTAKKKVLMVDDAAVVRQIVTLTLTNAGYEVIQAIDGNDALTKLRTNNISMVITDLNMPGMDGIEFIRQVRGKSEFRFMPVVMLTTQSRHPKERREKRRAPAAGYVNPSLPHS